MQNEGQYTPPVSPLKRFILRAFAWGVGCGLTISIILLSVFFYMERPKGWDTRGLRVKKARAEGFVLFGDRLEEKSTGTLFTIDLENTTGTDITLPQSVMIMEASKETRALHGSLLKLEKEYFIPAHHVVTISLSNSDLCAAKVEGQTCFERYFKDEAEIVIFDEGQKYEIHIPIPAFTSP